MAAETQYTASNKVTTISTANSNLDGSTGTYYLIFETSGSDKDAYIKTITVKAIETTEQGMVRIFVYDTSVKRLIKEIPIPAMVQSGTNPAFETVVPLNLCLEANWDLYASTEKTDSFNIIVEAQDWKYYATSVRSDTTKYNYYDAGTTISTANSNLDGSGTLGTVLISSGCNLQSIFIKATVSTTAGMVRLFLYDGTNNKLWKEVPVPAVTKSATAMSFEHRIDFPNGFVMKSGWQLKVSTQNAEEFDVVASSLDWSYPA